MIHVRLLSLAFIAALAMSAVVASAASAVTPEFRLLPTVTTFKSTSGAGTLKAGETATTTCTSDENIGTITGMMNVGKVTVTFHGCKTKDKAGEVCTQKSVGASSEGLIVTSLLDGEFGTVKSTEATSEVGLLLLPESGNFVELAGNKCTPLELNTPVTGSVAGEVETNSGKPKPTGKLTYATTNKAQKIKEITVLSGVKKPKLKAFGIEKVTEETTDTLEFASNVEVV